MRDHERDAVIRDTDEKNHAEHARLRKRIAELDLRLAAMQREPFLCDALHAGHDRIAELERERDYLLEIDGRAHIRAERAEDRAEKLERRLTAAREAMECAALTAEQWMHMDGWEEPMAEIRNGLREAALADDRPGGA